MQKRMRLVLSTCLLLIVTSGVMTLIGGSSFTASAAPPCAVQCRIDYKKCLRICGQPNVNCLVACETVRDWCLAGCGDVTQ